MTKFNSLMEDIRKGSHAYLADSTFNQIDRRDMEAWTAFAEGKAEDALKQMSAAAELQDKVGPGEVDIPSREMLADMLLELHQPQQALGEYEEALKISPNRLNGLYHAGNAAEEAGDKSKAAKYYTTLLKSTSNGSQSARQEFAHLKEFLFSSQVAGSN